MKVAIYSRFQLARPKKHLKDLIDALCNYNCEVYLEREFYALAKEKGFVDFPVFDTLDESFDLLISLGGDGTMLRAVSFLKDFDIPVVGVNTGRLGFLATVQTDEIKFAVEDIMSKNYKISERSLLQIAALPDNKAFEVVNFALNEITVSRKDTTSMITVQTKLNNEYLTSYWSDGLIISTPTGSTGYSLSCGGPVITPNTKSFIITPIAPHNLSARPLVIEDDTEIELQVSGREDQFLVSLDSRIATLSNDSVIKIKKADFKIRMIEFYNESFLVTLRKKLLWGEDKRN